MLGQRNSITCKSIVFAGICLGVPCGAGATDLDWRWSESLRHWIYAQKDLNEKGGWMFLPGDVSSGPAPEEQHWMRGHYELEDYLPATTRVVSVRNQEDLDVAVAAARPGDRIRISAGTYEGFTLASVSGRQENRIVFEAADFHDPPVFTSRIRLFGAAYVTIYRLNFSGIADDAVRIEYSNEIQIARCSFFGCDPRVTYSDRHSSGFEFRNNYVDSRRQWDAASGLSVTQIARDGRPGNAAVAAEDQPWRAKIWHNLFESTALNSVSGATQGHWVYDQTDRYCGCVDQQSSIKYNWVKTPRKHVPELKAGGWTIIGNYIGRAAGASPNVTVNIRQTSDAAPAGTGTNIFRGNVYDGILEVNIRGTGGGGAPQYMNGDVLTNGTRMRLFRNSDAGAHGDRAPHGMRLDYVGGGPVEIGFSWNAATGPVEGVELHECSFTEVVLSTETGTVQVGLEELEPQFPTHVLERHEVGPEVFRARQQ